MEGEMDGWRDDEWMEGEMEGLMEEERGRRWRY